MRIMVDMPYSQIMPTINDDPRGLAKLSKFLTIDVKEFVTGSEVEVRKVCLLEEGNRFRTGLLSRLKMVAPTFGLPVEEIRYSADRPSHTIKALTEAQVSLRDYQEEAVNLVLAQKMGVVYMATGGGKTRVAAAMIARQAVPTIFLVHTKELLWQTKKQFENLLGVKVGVIGDGEDDIQDVTVATIQTLTNKPSESLKDRFEMVIQDETHHVPADTFYYVTAKFNANRVYGLSATPYRSDGADLMIEAAVGPIVTETTLSDLIEKKWLVQPLFWVLPVPGQTSYSPMRRHIILRKYLVENEWRNKKISDCARAFAARNETVLITVNQVKHAKLIQEQLERDGFDGAEIMDGSMHSLERKKLLDRLQSKKLLVMISTLMKEGVDVPSLNWLIMGDGGRDSTQLVGRVLRKEPGKESAGIVDFIDSGHVTLLKTSQARMKRYKNERAFLIMTGSPV